MRKNVIIIFIFACAVYASTLFNSFMWDDSIVVSGDPLVQNNDVKNLFSLNYWNSIPDEQRDRFRPIRTASFVLDHMIYGSKPYGYHLTNIIFNGIAAVLLYIFAVIIFKNESAALIAAFVFILHPAHVETVAWIKNRSDIFCAVFMLSGLIAFIKYRGPVRWCIVAAGFAGALMSKEAAIVYPVFLWLSARFFIPQEERKNAYAGLWVLAAVTAGSFILKEMLWKNEILKESHVLMDAYLQTRIVFYTLNTYFTILLFPFNLSAERNIDFNTATLQAIGAGGIIFITAALLFGAGRLWIKKYPESIISGVIKNGAFAYLFIIAALLPVSNIVFIEARPIAEQRLYIPSIGFSLMTGIIISFLITAAKQKIKFNINIPVKIIAGLLIISGMFLSVSRTFVWKDDFTFWSETVKRNPNHYRANFNLGMIYITKGDIKKAAEYFETASKDCDRFEVNNYLARCYDDLGRYDDAIKVYEGFIHTFPDVSPDIINNLGIAYEKKKDYKNAEKYYLAALDAEKENIPAKLNLARIYEIKGMIKKAKQIYTSLMELPYTNQEVINIASSKLTELKRGL